MARKYVEFSEVAGKQVKNLTLFTASDFHAIAVRASASDVDRNLRATDRTEWRSTFGLAFTGLRPIHATR